MLLRSHTSRSRSADRRRDDRDESRRPALDRSWLPHPSSREDRHRRSARQTPSRSRPAASACRCLSSRTPPPRRSPAHARRRVRLKTAADGEVESGLIRGIDCALTTLVMRRVLRMLGGSSSRFHARRRCEPGCEVADHVSGPSSSPHRFGRAEIPIGCGQSGGRTSPATSRTPRSRSGDDADGFAVPSHVCALSQRPARGLLEAHASTQATFATTTSVEPMTIVHLAIRLIR